MERKVRPRRQSAVLLERSFPRAAWFKPAGPQTLDEKVVIDAQKAGIKEGQAELVVSVRDFSLNGLFKGNETLQRISVIMDTVAPRPRTSSPRAGRGSAPSVRITFRMHYSVYSQGRNHHPESCS